MAPELVYSHRRVVTGTASEAMPHSIYSPLGGRFPVNNLRATAANAAPCASGRSGLVGPISFWVALLVVTFCGCSRDPRTELFRAIGRQDIEGVKAALVRGADPNSRDEKGETAMSAAARSNRLEIVKLLLARGADVDRQGPDGSTPLMVAAFVGNKELFDLILGAGADPAHETSTGACVLSLSALNAGFSGRREIIDEILARKVVSKRQLSGAIVAAAFGGSPDVVKTLLAAGADVNGALNVDGNTALLAAVGGYGATIKNTAHDESPESLRNAGKQILDYRSTIKLLLESGADVSATNRSHGYTAVLLAYEIPDKELVHDLVSHGADPLAEDENESSPMKMAILLGDVETVTMFLSAGADPNRKSKSGATLLGVAASGKPAIISALLAAGAKPNEPDHKGMTPLIHAVLIGNVEAVQLLLSHGADPNAKYNELTALAFAKDRSPAMVELLTKAGANQ